jgi:hypothetical protein
VLLAAWFDYLRFWVWTAETWAAFQFGVLAAAAAVAYRQLGEARRLREASLRPFVVVDFDIEEDIEIYLSITNMGATLARDVTVTFDHPFDTATMKRPEGEDRPIDRFVNGLAKGIPTLAPGKKLRTLLDLPNHRAEANGLRDAYVAAVSYRSDVTGKPYSETYTIDMAVHQGRMWVNKKGLHQLTQEVEKIGNEIAKVNRNGVEVLNRRDRHLRRAELTAHFKSRIAPRSQRWWYGLKRRALLRLM